MSPKLLGLLAWALAAQALAYERWDHEGAVSLTAAVGGDVRNAAGSGMSDSGGRGNVEVGGALALTRRTELRLAGRAMVGAPIAGWAATLGIRNSFGDRLKTFFDLDVVWHVAPFWTVGPRFGVGVQYELTPVVGLFTVAAAQLGFGAGLRIGGELLFGVQLRSYLLEG